jgi:hypothetical protein
LFRNENVVGDSLAPIVASRTRARRARSRPSG